VLDLEGDLDAAMREIAEFYQARQITPRVYSAGLPGESEALRPALAKAGFQSEDYPLRWFFLEGSSRVHPDATLEVRRVHALDDALIGLINADGEEPWNVGVLERHVRCDRFHLLVGYIQGEPVTRASLKLMNGIGRVDDVFTHPKHRGHGYARTLMHHLVQCHRRLTSGPLYLWAENPTAIRVYEDVGFVELEGAPPTWAAWLA
jgi:GNAT superfamily N-acetyltransferase